MPERVDAVTRSYIMSRVRSKDTSPELAVRSALHRAGIRFRLHGRDLPGTPDLVLPRHRMVVFVHGCFWHGHGCSRARVPQTNTEYWVAKIARNRRRDALASRRLRALGWRVCRVWTCALDSGIARVVHRAAASPKLG